MTEEHSDTYTTQWRSPVKTGGQWRDVVSRGTFAVAKQALDEKVRTRFHCRIVVHSHGREDYTIDERGPFNGSRRAEDRP